MNCYIRTEKWINLGGKNNLEKKTSPNSDIKIKGIEIIQLKGKISL